jgi:hypothetical protein
MSAQTETPQNLFIDMNLLNVEETKVVSDAELNVANYRTNRKESPNDYETQLKEITLACSRAKFVVRSLEKRQVEGAKFI